MTRTYKLILWSIIMAAMAVWFWAALFDWLKAPLWSAVNFKPSLIVAVILLLSVTAIGLALFQRKRDLLVFAGIISILYLFQFGFDQLNIVGIGIFFLLALYSLKLIRNEAGQRFKINPSAILRNGLTPLVVALFMLVSFAAFQSPAVKSLGGLKQLPSSSQVFVQKLIENTVGGQIEGTGAQKQSIINQIASQTIGQANMILSPYFQYAPPALAFALFLILWGLSWFFIWLSVGAGVLIFWLLKKVNFVRIEEKDVKAEALAV